MHKHDLDLIAEHAAGTLGDESEARARIESCQTCAEEYMAQSSALAALSGIGQERMTEHERAQLHRDLWTELRSPAATAPRANPWWRSRAFGAAAFVVVAVSLVGVMENFGGGDSSENSNGIAAELDSGADGSGDARFDEDTAGGEEEGGQALAPDVTTAEAEEYENTPYLLIAREVRQGPKADPGVLTYDEKQSDCLEQSGLDDHHPVSGFETVTDLLVAVPSGADLETAPVAFVDPENCTVVHIED
ncbi:MAG: hypothetical protein WEF28_10770 [Acidimicrobiia bacterium]